MNIGILCIRLISIKAPMAEAQLVVKYSTLEKDAKKERFS